MKAESIISETAYGHAPERWPNIKRSESPDTDDYTGPAEDLLASGLLRKDQLPPVGKFSRSWHKGIYQRYRCPRDEHFLRVMRHDDGTVTVQIGVPAQIAAPRRAAAREARRRERDESRARWNAQQMAKEAQERTKQAASARQNLKETMAVQSEEDFRREVAGLLRTMASVGARIFTEPSGRHGYQLHSDASEAIMIASDALVEAMLTCEVTFDADLHASIIARHKAVIRAADPAFHAQLDKMTTPNPCILQGEAS